VNCQWCDLPVEHPRRYHLECFKAKERARLKLVYQKKVGKVRQHPGVCELCDEALDPPKRYHPECKQEKNRVRQRIHYWRQRMSVKRK